MTTPRTRVMDVTRAQERYLAAQREHQQAQKRADYSAADSGYWYRKLSALLREVVEPRDEPEIRRRRGDG
jgi:hypothetical protein